MSVEQLATLALAFTALTFAMQNDASLRLMSLILLVSALCLLLVSL